MKDMAKDCYKDLEVSLLRAYTVNVISSITNLCEEMYLMNAKEKEGCFCSRSIVTACGTFHSQDIIWLGDLADPEVGVAKAFFKVDSTFFVLMVALTKCHDGTWCESDEVILDACSAWAASAYIKRAERYHLFLPPRLRVFLAMQA